MAKQKNVLIFPAGTEIAFEIVNALKYSKFVELYGANSSKDHSEFIYKNLVDDLPYIDEDNFLTEFNKVIDKNNIDIVYTAHDSASVFLSEHKQEVHAEVIITDKYTTEVCRSKGKTYELFKDYDFIPRVYTSIDEIREFPVFVKPDIGQGSKGARKVFGKKHLEELLESDEKLLIMEYMPGEEFTVDCLTDKNGKLLVTKLRDRERIKTGIAVRSKEIEADKEIINIANIINSKLNFLGAWFFQVKKDKENKYKLLEVSPRIPGTMGLSRNLGINFPLLTLFIHEGYDVEIIDNDYPIIVDRAFYSAYKVDIDYKHIYIDFDDTLIINDKVNVDMIRFLYQEKNKGKTIHLLSKHFTDIYKDLKKFCISENLFDDIKVINKEDEKINYINESNAIFIDDSFQERIKVKNKKNIPVFDVDMIESLIDYKI